MKYYDLKNIKKKNKLFNFVISPRSSGKTISMKKEMVEIGKHGKKFVYIRRRGKEIESKKMDDFFTKLQKIGFYENDDLSFKKGSFFLNGNKIGDAVALSTANNVRSADFTDIEAVFFEEFIIKKDGIHDYLTDEVFKFFELYETISRDTDVPVFFLGNMIHAFNPYFLFLDIIPPESGIKTWKDCAIEVWKNKSFIDDKKKTRFHKLISGSAYSEYSASNQSYEDNDAYIRPIPANAKPAFKVLTSSITLTFFVGRDGSVTVGENLPGNVPRFTTVKEKSQPDVPFVKHVRTTSPYLEYYISCVKMNRVYTTSRKVDAAKKELDKALYF